MPMLSAYPEENLKLTEENEEKAVVSDEAQKEQETSDG